MGCRAGPWSTVAQRPKPGGEPSSEWTLKKKYDLPAPQPDFAMLGCGQGGALTKVPQAALTGADAHLQHVHQLKVIYLGQGALQKSMKSQPGGLDSSPSLPLAVGLGQVADISMPHLC